MLEKGKSTTGLARTIVDWAKGVGARHNAALLRGDSISYYEGAQYRLADALVFQVRILLRSLFQNKNKLCSMTCRRALQY